MLQKFIFPVFFLVGCPDNGQVFFLLSHLVCLLPQSVHLAAILCQGRIHTLQLASHLFQVTLDSPQAVWIRKGLCSQNLLQVLRLLKGCLLSPGLLQFLFPDLYLLPVMSHLQQLGMKVRFRCQPHVFYIFLQPGHHVLVPLFCPAEFLLLFPQKGILPAALPDFPQAPVQYIRFRLPGSAWHVLPGKPPQKSSHLPCQEPLLLLQLPGLGPFCFFA